MTKQLSILGSGSVIPKERYALDKVADDHRLLDEMLGKLVKLRLEMDADRHEEIKQQLSILIDDDGAIYDITHGDTAVLNEQAQRETDGALMWHAADPDSLAMALHWDRLLPSEGILQ